MGISITSFEKMLLFHLICLFSISYGIHIPTDSLTANASAVQTTSTRIPNMTTIAGKVPTTFYPTYVSRTPMTTPTTAASSTPSSTTSSFPSTTGTVRGVRIDRRKEKGTPASGVDRVPDPNSLDACYSRSNSSTAPAANADDLSSSSKEHSRTLIRGSHKFSLDMIKFLSNFESKETSEGILVSPYSVWSALVVMYMGSRGETESEIRSALRLQSIPKHSIGMAYQGLRLWYQLKQNSSDIVSTNRKYAYSAANRIFVNKQYNISSCIKSNFPTEVQSMNFADPEASIASINAWVETLTHGKIKHLMGPDSLTPWSQIVIANAVYFKSQWMTQFDQANSAVDEFHVNPVESMNVTFMKQTGSFMYGISETLGATALDLPYADQQFSMLILLPETSTGVDSLLKSLQPNHIYDLVSHMYSDEVEVSLPKFRLEQEFDLSGPLFSLGVKRLFDPRYADLSGFFANASHFDSALTVNGVIHKTAITVNEEGTEAAAATAFVVSRSGRPLFPTKFTANRPFIFLIRDTATNVILFTGVVRRPNQSSA